MKRSRLALLSSVLLILLFCGLASAQGLTGKGFKVGLNIADLHSDIDYFDDGKESKLGFCVGGFLTFSLHEMFAIQPEVLYTMKGARWDIMDVKLDYNLNYLEIPVLAKLTIPAGGVITPNLFVGPALGIELSAKYKMESPFGDDEGDIEDTKSTDFGLVLGGGLDFDLVKGKITFDARYTLGLTTIDDEQDEEAVTNGVISFMLGYSF